jgi:hypothetical protein
LWSYKVNDTIGGPVDENGIRALYNRGFVTTETLVCKEGTTEWMRLSETHLIYRLASEAAIQRTISRPVPSTAKNNR